MRLFLAAVATLAVPAIAVGEIATQPVEATARPSVATAEAGWLHGVTFSLALGGGPQAFFLESGEGFASYACADLDGASVATITRVFTAAHDNSAEDVSVISDPKVDWLDSSSFQWVVYASRAKHATFPTQDACKTPAGSCGEEDCGELWQPVQLLMPVFNAGEPEAPRAAEMGKLDFPGETVWGEAEFCGGLTGSGGCSSSIASKLTEDPFLARGL